MENGKGAGQHKMLHALTVVATTVIFAIVVAFNYLSSRKDMKGIFLNSTGDIADKYFLEVTPAGWTFGIVWGIIYLWNGAALVYCLTTLCRKGPDGEYLYVKPPMTPPMMYISLSLNLICNITWLFMWDRQYISACIVPISLSAFFIYCAFYFTVRPTKDNAQGFYVSGKGKEFWLVILLVHNGFAFYATWLTIATLLNFAIMGTYAAGTASMSTSCSVILAVVTVEALVWFILDITVLDSYTRYVFTPHVVLCMATGGSYDKNWDADKPNSVFTLFLFCLFLVLTLTKFVVMAIRHKRSPVVSAIA